ncbi:PfkB family carbohydrate kinase [Amnibacterium kyonggiense]|uniref:Ribokinase n=1 Tax=Amnibacterium kyonggiense TaxID=595671 RepID=A0A4R7FIN6_9MICO|nr:PfkB family carbohydrate kinase [Amnibacterium kyonggiense]TDS74838.1 ribokinase [Amnibacterium kyonggiense]
MTNALLTVVGSVNEDVTMFSTALPAPGGTVLATSVRRSAGGKGANQAAAAAALVGRSRLIGAVGRDAFGDRMLDALRSAHVDVSLVRRVSIDTGRAYISVDPSGENSIVVAPGANASVVVPPTLRGPVLCQLEVPVRAAIEAARATDGFFALNAAPATTLPRELIDDCDLVVVNEAEYAAMPELRDARLVVVTLGADGAAAFERGVEIARASGRPAEVVSSVGAGDAFCAAVVLAIASGSSVSSALAVACAVACAVGAAAVASLDARPALGTLTSYFALSDASTPRPT